MTDLFKDPPHGDAPLHVKQRGPWISPNLAICMYVPNRTCSHDNVVARAGDLENWTGFGA